VFVSSLPHSQFSPPFLYLLYVQFWRRAGLREFQSFMASMDSTFSISSFSCLPLLLHHHCFRSHYSWFSFYPSFHSCCYQPPSSHTGTNFLYPIYLFIAWPIDLLKFKVLLFAHFMRDVGVFILLLLLGFGFMIMH
jgi:hypothetical protein